MSKQTINTLPAAGSSFLTDLDTFLTEEIPDYARYHLYNTVIEGGIGATDATLTHTISAVTAFPNAHYVYQAATSHTYTGSTRTFVYVRDDNTRTVTVAAATVTYDDYLVFVEMAAASDEPAVPEGCVYLFYADTSAVAITAVTDRRVGGIIPLSRYDDLDAALTAIGDINATLLVTMRADVDDDETVPSNVSLAFTRGGQFIVASTKTLTVYSPENVICSDRVQCFGGSGDTVFTVGGRVPVGWFGAVADGSTDSTAAVQAAIDAMPDARAGTLVFPSGQTCVDRILVDDKAYLTITGEGGNTLIPHTYDTCFRFTDTHDFRVTGLNIYGTYQDSTPIDANTVNRIAISIRSDYSASGPCYNGLIDNNIFRNIGNNAIYQYCYGGYIHHDITYTDNQFYTVLGAVCGMGGLRINITNNLIYQDMSVVEGEQPVDDAIGWESRGAAITGDDNKAMDDMVITGNIIDKGGSPTETDLCANGIYVKCSNACTNLLIANNVIRNCITKADTFLANDGGAAIKVRQNNTYDSQNILIANNTIVNSLGIRIQDDSTCVIDGNSIYNSYAYGIYVRATQDDVRIRNCYIETVNSIDNVSAATYPGDGIIYVHKELINTVVKNCGGIGVRLYHDNTIMSGCVVDTCVDDNIIVVQGDNVTIRDTYSANSTADGIENRGDHTRIDNCIFYNNGESDIDFYSGTENRALVTGYYEETVTTGSPTLLRYGITWLDSSGGAITATLPDGDMTGQRKIIKMSDASTSSTVSVTSHATSSPEVFTFAATTDYLELVWDDTEWNTVVNRGANPCVLTGSDTWNPGNLIDGAQESKDFTVTGAALGDIALVGAGVDVTDLLVSAVVTAANTVTVTLANETGGAVDLASSTWNVRVIQV